MRRDYIIGMMVVFVLVAIAGFAGAATTYYVGGGQVGNLSEPTADTDAATKAYVDNLAPPTCVPKYDLATVTGGTTVRGLCSTCEGFVTAVIVTTSLNTVRSAVKLDGVFGDNFSTTNGAVARYFVGRFDTSASVSLYAQGGTTGTVEIYWCQDV